MKVGSKLSDVKKYCGNKLFITVIEYCTLLEIGRHIEINILFYYIKGIVYKIYIYIGCYIIFSTALSAHVLTNL